MSRPPSAHPSILGRLRRGIVAALAVSSALTFGALFAIGRAQRVHAFEQALGDDLRTISNITEVYPGDDVYVNVEPESLSEYMRGGDRFFQLWDAGDHELLDRSASLEALQVTLPHPGQVGTTPRRYDAKLPDGRRVSLIAVQLDAHWGLDAEMLKRTRQTIQEHRVDLLVGRLSQELDDALAPLAWACAAGAFALPLVAAAALAWLVPRALRPLQALGEAVSARNSDDLQPFEAQASEIEPIVQRLNELLQRIAQARERERRFLGDTAHELRTPLSELHTLADVALLDPADTAAQASALQDMREVTRRMALLLDALFRLSRQGRTGDGTRRQRLPLGALAQQALDAQLAALVQQQLRVHRAGDPEVWVDADPVMLRALIDNLAGNAIDHAQPGTVIELRHTRGAEGPSLAIANVCGDASRGERQPHLGRGLTLAALYAQVLQATLTTGRRGDRFEATLSWPADATAGITAPG